MNICLATLHPRVLSGQVDSLAGLGRALVRRGHTVSLTAPFPTDGLLDRSLISLDGGPRGLGGAAVKMLRTVPRIIADGKGADLVHIALPTPAFSWVGDVVQAALSVPLVVSYEGHLAPAGQLLQPERLRRSWRTYLPLWGVNNGLFGRLTRYGAEHYVVSSEYQRLELAALGAPAARVSVISNVIESEKLARCDPEQARTRLHLPAGKQIVGYMGHFNDVKGVDVLARAFAEVRHHLPDAHLALAWSGQGKQASVLAPLAGLADAVTVLGKVHVGTFLCAIDALALPYRCTAGQGAYPSLVIEALHAACPLVTSRLPLLEELLADSGGALFCPPEQPALLAEQLRRLLCDGTLRRKMQEAQLAAVRTRFAPDLLSVQYEVLYEKLLPAVAADQAAA